MTLKLGLVGIFTKAQINTIGLFDWQYRGDGGDICNIFFYIIFAYISTRERICFQNTAVLSLYERSRFVCVLH